MDLEIISYYKGIILKNDTSCNLKCVKNNKTISKSVCLENRIELASLSEIIVAFCGGSKFLSLLSLLSKIFLNNIHAIHC